MVNDFSKYKRALLSFNLSFIAGMIDIIGFILGGQIFLSFMSGNSTHFVFGIVNQDFDIIFRYGITILSFIVGSFLGDFLFTKTNQNIRINVYAKIILALIALMLLFLNEKWLVFLMFALMMGFQNSIHIFINGVETGKGFVTNILYMFGASISQVILKKQGISKTLWLAFTWFSLISGALIGGLLTKVISLEFIIVIIIAIYVIILLLLKGSNKNN